MSVCFLFPDNKLYFETESKLNKALDFTFTDVTDALQYKYKKFLKTESLALSYL